MADTSDIKTESKDEPRDNQDEGGDDEVSSRSRDSIVALSASTATNVVEHRKRSQP